MKGSLFGVGVGPGDPSLLTLKAVDIIKSADVIAVPDTGGEKTALNVVAAYLGSKEIMPCPMPMTKDREFLRRSHENVAEMICERLDGGQNVAFITLGDPSIYSTYMYIHKLVEQKGYSVQMIPGVPSFCAAACALGIPLCEGGEVLHIFPASYGGLEENLALKGGKVLMKSGSKTADVLKTLKNLGLRAQMVECCGMENERIYRNIDEAAVSSNYFSIIVVKEQI
jgi:precorrin-2/cobalt-factor-2 C20-methyltransferase